MMLCTTDYTSKIKIKSIITIALNTKNRWVNEEVKKDHKFVTHFNKYVGILKVRLIWSESMFHLVVVYLFFTVKNKGKWKFKHFQVPHKHKALELNCVQF